MSNPFPSMNLQSLAIKDQLLAIYHPGAWWFSIENALVNKTHPLKDIFKMILDQYNSAPTMVLDVIDHNIIKQIQLVYNGK